MGCSHAPRLILSKNPYDVYARLLDVCGQKGTKDTKILDVLKTPYIKVNKLSAVLADTSRWKFLKVKLHLKLCITVVLWTGCIGAWFRHLTRRQIDPRIWTDCKLYYYLFYFATDYSSMLLVLMSLEKCFAVYFPLKSKTVCTVKTAKWATGIIGIIMAGYNLVYIFVLKASIIKSSGLYTCVYIGNSRVIVEAVDSVLYSFGPFTLMFITNFAIVFKFMRAKCTRNSTESTNQALVKSATRGTAMVVTVSVTFIILTARLE